MAKVVYNVYTVINGNASDLNPGNLAPIGEVDFPRKVVEGQQVDATYTMGERKLVKIFYKVVKIITTGGTDGVVLVETGRKDLE